jgi:hypothetical protein
MQQCAVISDDRIQNTAASSSVVPDITSELQQSTLDIPSPQLSYEYSSDDGNELYLLGAPTACDDASAEEVRSFEAAFDAALDQLYAENQRRADAAARDDTGYSSDVEYSDGNYNCMSLRDWTSVLTDCNDDIDDADTETCSSDHATAAITDDIVVDISTTSSDTNSNSNSSYNDDEQSAHQFWLDNAAAAFSSDPTATARWTPQMCTALNSAVEQLKSLCDTTVVNTVDIDWELIALVLTYTKVCTICYTAYYS